MRKSHIVNIAAPLVLALTLALIHSSPTLADTRFSLLGGINRGLERYESFDPGVGWQAGFLVEGLTGDFRVELGLLLASRRAVNYSTFDHEYWTSGTSDLLIPFGARYHLDPTWSFSLGLMESIRVRGDLDLYFHTGIAASARYHFSPIFVESRFVFDLLGQAAGVPASEALFFVGYAFGEK